jgi:uncharacterized membrane protein
VTARNTPPISRNPDYRSTRKTDIMPLARFLHIVGLAIWIGGMFFAYMALRPVAASRLEAPQRLALWEGVFGKFFAWVWLAVALILASGFYMMREIGRPPPYVSAMFIIGIVMMLIFAHVFFAPYKRLRRAVSAQDWPAGGTALAQIRKMVGLNLLLGFVTIACGALGPLLNGA